MENDYKVLNVNTSTSTKLHTLGNIIQVFAILTLVASVVFCFMWITDYSYDGEDYIIPFFASFASSISLFISGGVLRGLFKITEAAEFQKAHIAQQYNSVRDEDSKEVAL